MEESMMQSKQADPSAPAHVLALPAGLSLPLEVRVHGRGGQGGVTCAKLIALLYTRMGMQVQTFGDYGSERSGAPVQAYTRVDCLPINNHNKVYRPDHLIVLDEGLMGPLVLSGAVPGGVLLLNSHCGLESYAGQYGDFRFGVIDATAIAREHGIGSSSVVIINTTMVGAYARLLGVSLAALDETFAALGLGEDLAAAEHAFERVQMRDAVPGAQSAAPARAAVAPPVTSISEHRLDFPADLKTGSWSNQSPLYREQPAPCNLACPAGNDVVGFIQALKKDGADAAAAILLRTQPLPSVCGRVCPAPCMASCNRLVFDGAVNIRSLERWVGDHSAHQPVAQTADLRRRFAVIGGGPAGLAAAWQLALAGHAVTIHEAGPALGGVLRNGIPAYRLPDEVLQRDLARIMKLGVEAQCNSRLDRDGAGESATAVRRRDRLHRTRCRNEAWRRGRRSRRHRAGPGFPRPRQARTCSPAGAGHGGRRRQYGDGLRAQRPALRRDGGEDRLPRGRGHAGHRRRDRRRRTGGHPFRAAPPADRVQPATALFRPRPWPRSKPARPMNWAVRASSLRNARRP
jgi:2-oxoacid:acceptor oxidoreductase gamma subunit (pyruvate/2-ketoisovalerate family)